MNMHVLSGCNESGGNPNDFPVFFYRLPLSDLSDCEFMTKGNAFANKHRKVGVTGVQAYFGTWFDLFHNRTDIIHRLHHNRFGF